MITILNFGTIKRQWGFSYILTKEGMNRASADVGFIFIAYNIRRIISILDKDMFGEYLRILVSLFFHISSLFRRKISLFEISIFRRIFFPGQIQPSLRSLQIDRKNRESKRFLDRLPLAFISATEISQLNP
jgi:hypothetical protein